MSNKSFGMIYYGLFFSILFLFFGCEQKPTAGTEIGQILPELEVEDMQSKPVRLADFRENVIVLQFWVQGCSACILDMPEISRMYEKHKGKGLVILGIHLGGETDLVEAYAKKRNISYPVLIDPLLATQEKYGIQVIPTTFILDKSGRIQDKIVGETTGSIFESRILARL